MLDLLDNVGGRLKINLTDNVIPCALEYAVPNPSQRGQMTPGWRSMSGAAHALVWHYSGPDGLTAADPDEGGVGLISVEGKVQRLVADYFTAYHVAAAGWRLLQQRCRPPA